MRDLLRTIGLPILLGLLFLAIYLAFHLGLFKGVQLTEITEPPLVLLALEHRGAYHEINEVIKKVEDLAREKLWPCPKTFGLYLDDPQSMEPERLTSFGGCLLGAERPEMSVSAPFRIIEIPAGAHLKAQFSGSPAIGPWRVYPRLVSRWQELMSRPEVETKWPQVIEFYTVTSQTEMTTEYYAPLFELSLENKP